MQLTKRELATVLSALRLSQWHLEAESLEAMLKDPVCQARCDAIDEIAEGAEGGALSVYEIDRLCEKLNKGG